MTPAAAELIAQALGIVTSLIPTLQADFQKGAVTDAQQAALQAAIDLLPNDFSGPEWQAQPAPASPA